MEVPLPLEGAGGVGEAGVDVGSGAADGTPKVSKSLSMAPSSKLNIPDLSGGGAGAKFCEWAGEPVGVGGAGGTEPVRSDMNLELDSGRGGG